MKKKNDMNWKYFYVSALLLLFGGCAYYNTFFNAKRYYRMGQIETQKNRSDQVSAAERRNYELTIDKCQKLIELYPESKWVDHAYLLMGKCYYHIGLYRQSLRSLDQLEARNSQPSLQNEAKLWMAMNYLDIGRYEEASYVFGNIIENVDDNQIIAQAVFFQAQLYAKNGYFEQSNFYYIEAISHGLGNNEVHALLAIAVNYDSLQMYDKAAEYYQSVIRQNPVWEMRVEAEINYAGSLAKTGEYDRSVQILQRMLGNASNSKSFPDIKIEIAKILKTQNEQDNAILTLRDLIEDHPRSEQAAHAYYLLGLIYEQQLFDFERALDAYEKVRTENARFAKIDSAETKKRDIQRMLALQQVLRMAEQGRSGSLTIQGAADSDTTLLLSPVTSDTTIASADSLDLFTENMTDSITASVEEKAFNPELQSFQVEEQDRNLFLLAELYLFNFNMPEHAKELYARLIDEFPDSPYHVKALYNQAWMAENIFQNYSLSDSLQKIILKDYSESEFAEKAAFQSDDQKTESFKSLFLQAEDLLWNNNRPSEAFTLYQQALTTQPSHKNAIIALNASAWIAEHHLADTSMAIHLYNTLIEKYPESPHAGNALKKINILETEQNKEKAARQNTDQQ